MNMQATERLFLQTVGRFVKQWTAPLFERLERVEAAVLLPPIAFTPAQEKTVKQMIADALAERESNGADGDNVQGAAANRLRGLVAAAVADAVAALPVSPGVVSGYVDRDGDLYFTNSDGGIFKVGHVVGKDADQATIDAQIKAACEKYPPPKDGKDGFSLTNFTAEFDGERTLVLRFTSGEVVQEHRLVLPITVYREVWREGAYQRGDSVTLDGSTWIALADTQTRPGTPNSHWKLAVKKGRDGKDGKSITGPPGPPGKPGRDGHDLTQMGFDGRKY